MKQGSTTLVFLVLLSVAVITYGFAQEKVDLDDQEQIDQPVNIVLFVADDLGATDFNSYGDPVARTPNLDRLAEESMLFSQAFAASPTCSPSRAAIHTGLMPYRNGAHANHMGIREGIRTLPDYLQSLGYSVALAGKYHIGPKSAYPFELIHNTNVPEPGYEDRGVLWTDLNMEPVDEWLSENADDDPFMLVVNDHSPHVVWPEEAQYDPSNIDVPTKHIDTEDTRKSRARYYTDITKMDRNVGKLLESLEKHELNDNTIVIFTSDHGPQWAFGKWSLYDYGVRVPLLIRWPGVIKGGTSSNALVSLVDLLPTFIDLAGGEVPESPGKIDGMSFLPVLLGQENAHRERVYATHTGDGTMNRTPMRMVRTKRYKYIRNLAPETRYHTHMDLAKDHDGGREYWDSWQKRSYETKHAAWVLWKYHNRPAEELYDVRRDPNETRNLAADPNYAGVFEKLRNELKTWRERQGDSAMGPYDPPEEKRNRNVTPYIFD